NLVTSATGDSLMPQLVTSAALLALFLTQLRADDKPLEKPSRADRLKAIRDNYAKASDEFGKAIRAGTIKPNADGEYPGVGGRAQTVRQAGLRADRRGPGRRGRPRRARVLPGRARGRQRRTRPLPSRPPAQPCQRENCTC